MLYDITKSFEENCTFGPYWDGKFPNLPKNHPKTLFLGFSLNAPFGIPACPLTVNARCIGVVSRLGFDLLTYKSVRSVEWHGNPFPHWFYVNAPKNTDIQKKKEFTASSDRFWRQEPSMVNSFGIHSVKPEYWQKDFDRAQKNLLSGQLLILSMQTTPVSGINIIEDAKRLARLAKEVGARVVEINFACPNTDEGKGMIFDDIVLAPKVCEAMKRLLGKISLLIKVGFYKDDRTITELLLRTRGIIAGVSTVNTYPGKIVDKKGGDAFPNRPWGGVSGAVIRNLALAQAKTFVSLKRKLGLKKLAIIGIGGVTTPSHIKRYLNLGVDAVQSAVGAYVDPYLAYKYRKNAHH